MNDATNKSNIESRGAMAVQNELLAETLSKAPMVVLVLDLGGNLLYLNEAALDAHELPSPTDALEACGNADSSIARTLQSIVVFAGERAGDEPFKLEISIARSDESVVPLEVTARTIDWNGEPALLIAGSDVSRWKGTERLVDAERRQLLSIFDSIDQAIYVSDVSTHEVLYSNRHLRDRLGKDPVGQKCFQVLQGKNSPCEFCSNPLLVKEPWRIHGWEHANESINRCYWVLDRLIRWPDGRDVRFEIAFDITEQKKTERALARKLGLEGLSARTSAQFLGLKDIETVIPKALSEIGVFFGARRVSLNVLDDEAGSLRVAGSWPASPDGECGACSGLRLEELSWLAPQLEADRFVWIADTSTLPGEASVERRLLLDREAESALFVPLLSRGRLLGLLEFINLTRETPEEAIEELPLRTISAILSSALERARTERERIKLSRQLSVSQRMESIGLLAGGIAHDFNNLLTVISNYASLAGKSLPEDHSCRDDIDQIEKASQRAATLTRQLLAFSRKQVLQPKVFSLNTIVSGLDAMLRRLLGEDISIENHLSSDLGYVSSDPAQMEQVVVNLAINAREAMLQGGRLTIETSNVYLDADYARQHIAVSPGEYVMLSMTDTGLGIPREIQGRIFEPFFSTKERGKGTGLGLATVYGIVKQSGGDIWVYSEPGEGATFKVYLPRVWSCPTEAVVRPPLVEATGNETILLVEDDLSVRTIAERILREAGYFVISASSGEDAIALMREATSSPHLLLTDVVMTGMSGRRLADRLTELHPSTKVLYMSGYTDNAIVHHGVLDPGTNFIAKPFSGVELTRKVREVIEG